MARSIARAKIVASPADRDFPRTAPPAVSLARAAVAFAGLLAARPTARNRRGWQNACPRGDSPRARPVIPDRGDDFFECASARRSERRRPHDGVTIAEETMSARGSGADVSEARIEHVRSMSGRLNPRCQDVTCRHLSPRSGIEILTEGRVPIPGSANGCSHIGTARCM